MTEPIVRWKLTRLSREWVGPIVVAADGDPASGWTYTIVTAGVTPDLDDITSEPTVLDDQSGVLIGPGTEHELEPGRYWIWVRYVIGIEAPVFAPVGVLVIT